MEIIKIQKSNHISSGQFPELFVEHQHKPTSPWLFLFELSEEKSQKTKQLIYKEEENSIFLKKIV